MNKMALVPEAHVEELKRLRLYQRAKLPPKPEIIQTAEIQQNIDKLLTDTNITPQDKMQLFAEYMLKYNSFKEQAKGIDTNDDLPTEPTYKPVKETIAAKVTDEAILETIPNSMKIRVKKLLAKIDKNVNITWDANGVVSVKGKKIPSSNIVDIANDAARLRKTAPPVGWDDVANAIKDNNDSIKVGNSRWRNLLNSSTKKKPGVGVPSDDEEDSIGFGLFDRKGGKPPWDSW